jgi:hypothetical protein
MSRRARSAAASVARRCGSCPKATSPYADLTLDTVEYNVPIEDF